MTTTQNELRPNRRAAARAFEEAQQRALGDERLHVFAHCTCGVDGLLVWLDKDDDVATYWIEWWTSQPGTRLPWAERLKAAWRILTRGTVAEHELVLNVVAAERLASWLLSEGATAARELAPTTLPDLLAQREASWQAAEALFGVDTLIDAVVAKEVHDAGFYAGADYARRYCLTANNIVPGAGSGGTATIAAALAAADMLERGGDRNAAEIVRNVARLAAGYWEDLEEFGRLKDALADAMGLPFKCPIDVLQKAIDHFKATSS